MSPSLPNISQTAENTSTQITQDESLRKELIQILQQLLPDVDEHTAVSPIASEHARQLAENKLNTEFRVLQQIYDPISPGALQTRLLQEQVFVSDNLVNAYLSDGSLEAVRSRFRKQIESVIGPVDFSHYGIGVARKGNAWYVSTVLLTEILHINDLPMQLSSTGTRRINGEIRMAGFDRPSILVTRPDGQVEAIETKVSGSQFSADLPLSQSGLYSFEVNVMGPLGPLPGTNFVLA
ncbi:MAG: hypothetical protein CVV27_07775, partial [Candidatus Melainabacteria bacterium HGW-Melainabacteria-1]